MRWRSTRAIMAAITSTLSASGSINFPRVVTRRCLRAIYPSSESVTAAAMNTTPARRSPQVRGISSAAVRKRGNGAGVLIRSERNSKTRGARNTRTRLRMLGTFRTFVPFTGMDFKANSPPDVRIRRMARHI